MPVLSLPSHKPHLFHKSYYMYGADAENGADGNYESPAGGSPGYWMSISRLWRIGLRTGQRSSEVALLVGCTLPVVISLPQVS